MSFEVSIIQLYQCLMSLLFNLSKYVKHLAWPMRKVDRDNTECLTVSLPDTPPHIYISLKRRGEGLQWLSFTHILYEVTRRHRETMQVRRIHAQVRKVLCLINPCGSKELNVYVYNMLPLSITDFLYYHPWD